MSTSGSNRLVHPDNPFAELKLVGGALCLDFANSLASRPATLPRDPLAAVEDLVWWANRAGSIPSDRVPALLEGARRRGRDGAATLGRATELRALLRRIFSRVAGGRRPDARDTERLNAHLSTALAHRRLVPAAGAFRLGWIRTDGPECILWPVVHSAAELLASTALDRVGECAADGCAWLFVDGSRNRSRRWCDMADCGNRAKARRHYRRHRS